MEVSIIDLLQALACSKRGLLKREEKMLVVLGIKKESKQTLAEKD